MMSFRFFQGQSRKTHDSETIADCAQMSRGAIQFDQTHSGRSVDHISLEAFSILEITNKDFFVGEEPHHFGNVRGNGETAFIVQTRARHGGAMNLGF